ncbi:MAG: hypothetical protein ACRYGF_08145 [Janthinobacterium lividum]
MYGFSGYSLMGFLLGFMLGVGCALAVMYSIFMGGYRAALREAALPEKSKRYLEELAKVEKADQKAQ